MAPSTRTYRSQRSISQRTSTWTLSTTRLLCTSSLSDSPVSGVVPHVIPDRTEAYIHSFYLQSAGPWVSRIYAEGPEETGHLGTDNRSWTLFPQTGSSASMSHEWLLVSQRCFRRVWRMRCRHYTSMVASQSRSKRACTIGR